MNDLTERELAKISKIEKEDMHFLSQLNDFTDGKLNKAYALVIGNTPNSLKILGAPNVDLIINQSVLQNSINPETVKIKKHTRGHEISMDFIKKLPKELRNPTMIFKGKFNSVIMLSSLTDNNGKNIIIPVELNVQGYANTVNKVTSIYGRSNIAFYIKKQLNNGKLLACNKEKAERLLYQIGQQLPNDDTIISYDDSIAYTTKNVKYPAKPKNEKREDMSEMNDQKKIDEMYTQQAQLEAAYQAEMQSIIDADITPVIEEDIEFDEVVDMTKHRVRETEDLENSRKKAQEISEELIAAQKHTNLAEINNDIVDKVEKSDLTDMFPNEIMDYSKGTDTMLMLFDLADREKNAEAQNILGVCYFSGTNVMQDTQKSMEYFRDAAEQGHAGAARNLAIAMENTENPDKNEIISLYEKATDKNDAYAINNLAVVYLTGDGVKKDPKRAAKLFERAVKLGDDYAMVNLAYCYSIGNGVKYSEKEAFKLYVKAAEKDNIEGLRNAAECLLAGKGTKQDLEAALSYFSKAAQLGDIQSQQRVEELSGKLSGMKHDEVVVGAPEKKKSLSEVLNMGKQAAENSKSGERPDKSLPKEKGAR